MNFKIKEENRTYGEITINISEDVKGHCSVFLYKNWSKKEGLKDISTSKRAKDILNLLEAAPDLLGALKEIQLLEAYSADEWVSGVLRIVSNVLNENEINNL